MALSPETLQAIDRLADEMLQIFSPPELIPGCEVKSISDKDAYATDNGWVEAVVGRHNQQRCRWRGQYPNISVGDYVDVLHFASFRLFVVWGQGGSGALSKANTLHNFSATAAPTANDDSGDGYSVGSIWIDVSADDAYICVDATATAAVWEQIDSSGSGPLNNYSATSAPTANDDSGDGYEEGSIWVDVTNDDAYICVDATVAAAVWREMNPYGTDPFGHDHSRLVASDGSPHAIDCDLSGHVKITQGYIRGAGNDEAIRLLNPGADTWLRLNQAGAWASGVYTPGHFRADGGIDVNGGTFQLANGTSVNDIDTTVAWSDSALLTGAGVKRYALGDAHVQEATAFTTTTTGVWYTLPNIDFYRTINTGKVLLIYSVVGYTYSISAGTNWYARALLDTSAFAQIQHYHFSTANHISSGVGMVLATGLSSGSHRFRLQIMLQQAATFQTGGSSRPAWLLVAEA